MMSGDKRSRRGSHGFVAAMQQKIRDACGKDSQ
jgi:hypothetical protein